MREWVNELADAFESEMIVFDGLDDAIIGVTASSEPVVVYSERKIIELLVGDDDMTEEDAWDHYGFNILGLYAGPGTPIIVKDPE